MAGGEAELPSMTVLTRKQERLLEQLIALAGSGEAVQRAIRSLNDEHRTPPTLEEIVVRILENNREKKEALT